MFAFLLTPTLRHSAGSLFRFANRFQDWHTAKRQTKYEKSRLYCASLRVNAIWLCRRKNDLGQARFPLFCVAPAAKLEPAVSSRIHLTAIASTFTSRDTVQELSQRRNAGTVTINSMLVRGDPPFNRHSPRRIPA
jgi:hypothetical protein